MHGLSYNVILYIISVHYVVNSLIRQKRTWCTRSAVMKSHSADIHVQKYMWHTHKYRTGWGEWQSAAVALEIYSRHRKLCDKAEGACDHYYFHSFYFRDLRHVSCIPFLPTFCPLSSSCSYFYFLSFEQRRVQNCRLIQTGGWGEIMVFGIVFV